MKCCLCKDTIKSVMYMCCTCNNVICNKCRIKEFYYFNELFDISCMCSVCGEIICPNCALFCYECAIEGDIIEYCDECCPEDLKYIGDWCVCEKHI